jgi:hypothetical protein
MIPPTFSGHVKASPAGKLPNILLYHNNPVSGIHLNFFEKLIFKLVPFGVVNFAVLDFVAIPVINRYVVILSNIKL